MLELTVTELKQDVTELKQGMTELKQDVTGLKQDIAGLRHDVISLVKSQQKPAEANPKEISNLILLQDKELTSKAIPLKVEVDLSQI